MNWWLDKLQLKLHHMTINAGNAFFSCFIERVFKSGADWFHCYWTGEGKA
jgi:hypothetical protein